MDSLSQSDDIDFDQHVTTNLIKSAVKFDPDSQNIVPQGPAANLLQSIGLPVHQLINHSMKLSCGNSSHKSIK